MPRLLLVLSLLVSLSASAAVGTPEQLRDIDRFVETTLRTLPEVPSIGLAIVRDGQTYARGYGYADRERKLKADAQTGYYNGSNTKAYTAALVMMLVNEGVLDLDAPVTKYLPELRFAPPIDPAQLTLRRFLSHTSASRIPPSSSAPRSAASTRRRS